MNKERQGCRGEPWGGVGPLGKAPSLPGFLNVQMQLHGHHGAALSLIIQEPVPPPLPSFVIALTYRSV